MLMYAFVGRTGRPWVASGKILIGSWTVTSIFTNSLLVIRLRKYVQSATKVQKHSMMLKLLVMPRFMLALLYSSQILLVSFILYSTGCLLSVNFLDQERIFRSHEYHHYRMSHAAIWYGPYPNIESLIKDFLYDITRKFNRKA